jgi:hypothetical protein
MLDFKPCKRCNDGTKLLIERSSPVAASVVFLKAIHKIKKLISDILRIAINSVVLCNSQKVPCPLTTICAPLRRACPTVWKPLV